MSKTRTSKVSMAFRWLLVGSLFSVLVVANLEGSAVHHIAGAVCNGITETMAAHDFVRGKHLVVYDTPWKPFAEVDETTKSGWRGYDVDLLDELAAVLGFTYTIHSFSKEDNETWTDSLLRVASESDLVMSYWTRTQKRMDWLAMISGHLDYSSVLLAQEMVGQSVPIGHRMTAFFHPYTWTLWVCIVAMVLLSGVVDFLLEKHVAGVRLGPSIYEYMAGTLWGGFDYPRSIAAGVYQVVVAFLILVTISTYTANLTTFLTTSVKATLSAESVEDVMQRELTACSFSSYPHLSTYDAIYPRLQYKVLPNHKQVRAQLTNSGCDAAMVPKLQYDQWRMGTEACKLRIVQTIFPDTAGWATNRQSTCLQQAVDWALYGLVMNGKIDRLNRKWLPVAACSGVTPTPSRRLLFEDEEESQEVYDFVGSFQRHLSRRLLVGLEKVDVADEASVGTMSILDFAGIFSLWGITTVLVITLSKVERRYHSRLKAQLSKLNARLGLRLSQHLEDNTALKLIERRHGAIASNNVRERLEEMNLNIDNQADMNMKSLVELLSLREDLHFEFKKTNSRLSMCPPEVDKDHDSSQSSATPVASDSHLAFGHDEELHADSSRDKIAL